MAQFQRFGSRYPLSIQCLFLNGVALLIIQSFVLLPVLRNVSPVFSHPWRIALFLPDSRDACPSRELTSPLHRPTRGPPIGQARPLPPLPPIMNSPRYDFASLLPASPTSVLSPCGGAKGVACPCLHGLFAVGMFGRSSVHVSVCVLILEERGGTWKSQVVRLCWSCSSVFEDLCCCWCSCSVPQLNTPRVTECVHPHPYKYRYRP